MKKISIALAAISMLSLGACTTQEGAISGGVVGAAVGGVATNSVVGAVVGAGVGALAGAVLGQPRQQRLVHLSLPRQALPRSLPCMNPGGRRSHSVAAFR